MIRAIASSAFHALFGYCTTAFRGGVVIVKQAITVKCIWNPLRKLGAVKVPVSGKGTGGCKIFAPFGKIIHCRIWMEQTESKGLPGIQAAGFLRFFCACRDECGNGQ